MRRVSFLLDDLIRRLAIEPAILVSVVATRGSVPREVGAWMAVFASGQIGTIGGGHLEWAACQQARERLADPAGDIAAAWERSVVLGPALGQCCGGTVGLRFERIEAAAMQALAARLAPRLTPVALFGGGHVGRAIVGALAPLPFAVTWIDSRDEIFPAGLEQQVVTEHSEPVEGAVRDLLPGALVLIMSFSHAEDLDIVAACLKRQREQADLPFVGLIGSHTKWATFASRLRQRGWTDDELAHITSPIGLPGIRGKQPAVVAASVAAQLLLVQSGLDHSSDQTGVAEAGDQPLG